MTPDTESSKDLTTAEQSHISVKQNLDTTPDTEWEEEFDKTWPSLAMFTEFGQCDPKNKIKSFITTLLTSRDTYWKEREKEMLEVIKEAVALVRLLECDNKLSEADYELYGYGEACAIIQVYGEKLLAPINKDNLK